MNKTESHNITGLKRVLLRYKERYPNDFTGHTYLENAIQRATEKKVRIKPHIGLICPDCSEEVWKVSNDIKLNFCPNCGQALK